MGGKGWRSMKKILVFLISGLMGISMAAAQSGSAEAVDIRVDLAKRVGP